MTTLGSNVRVQSSAAPSAPALNFVKEKLMPSNMAGAVQMSENFARMKLNTATSSIDVPCTANVPTSASISKAPRHLPVRPPVPPFSLHDDSTRSKGCEQFQKQPLISAPKSTITINHSNHTQLQQSPPISEADSDDVNFKLMETPARGYSELPACLKLSTHWIPQVSKLCLSGKTLSWKSLSSSERESIMHWIHRNYDLIVSVEVEYLSKDSLSQSEWTTLLEALHACLNLRHLSLLACELRFNHVFLLGRLFSNLHSIRLVRNYFSDPPRSGSAMDQLISSIRNLRDNAPLTRLELRECDLVPQHARDLAQALIRQSSVHSIDVSENISLGDDGIQILHSLVKQNKSITTLHYAHCRASASTMHRVEAELAQNYSAAAASNDPSTSRLSNAKVNSLKGGVMCQDTCGREVQSDTSEGSKMKIDFNCRTPSLGPNNIIRPVPTPNHSSLNDEPYQVMSIIKIDGDEASVKMEPPSIPSCPLRKGTKRKGEEDSSESSSIPSSSSSSTSDTSSSPCNSPMVEDGLLRAQPSRAAKRSRQKEDDDVVFIKEVPIDRKIIAEGTDFVFREELPGLKVRESQLLRGLVPAQLGLFTMNRIEKGALVVWYTGKVYWTVHDYDVAVRMQPLDSPMCGLDVQHHETGKALYYIDGGEPDLDFGPIRCKATKINHHRTRNNVQFRTHAMENDRLGVRVAVHASRTIEAGKELLIDCGEAFHQVLRNSGTLRL